MKMYKVKHKPTGLFYAGKRRFATIPSTRGFAYTQLTKKGTVYINRPSRTWLQAFWLHGELIKNRAEDFEIIEFELTASS